MYRIFICITLLFNALTTLAQNSGTSVLSGKVTNTEGKTLPGMHVVVTGTTHAGITDANGAFTMMNVAPGKYTVQVSGIGFEKSEQRVMLTSGITTTLSFVLRLQAYTMPGVEILASNDRLFTSVPGSLSFISPLDLQSSQPVNGNEVLRKATGLNVVEEEGLGLRTNIGIRGLDPDRSRTVLMLEDGVPVALAPYGEPEMYYTPAIERMSSVEVLKGSGSILYGPQTIGGVINYQTIDPPASPEGFVKLTGGDGGFFTGLFGYGSTFGKTGVQVNYLRKQSDDFGSTWLRLNDISSKFLFFLNEKSKLGVKLGIYNEESNSTYIGLTQPMFEKGDQDYTALAPYDRLSIRRYSLSLKHTYTLQPKLRIETTAYGYTTTRDWQRQDFSYNSFDDNGQLNPKPSNYTGVTWGDESVEGGAIYMRSTTGNRNRSFEVAGVEPRVKYDFATGGLRHQLTGGIRFLYERAYEQRINGSRPDSRTGTITEDEIRTGYGYSAFAHNKITVTKSFSVTAGIRFEYFDYERDIRKGRFIIDGVASIRDTMVVSGSHVASFIPGAGFNFSPNDKLTVFGGVHRGFAPPRVKDAISSEGVAYELDAELSWNYEAGIRSTPVKWMQFEITGFLMDFENQVIPVSESSGGTGSGLVNGGRTRHTGAEAGLTISTRDVLKSRYHAELKSGISYVRSLFAADRYIGGTDDKININGNFTPYAPEWNFNGGIGLHAPFGLSLNFTGNYVSDQFSDEINTVASSGDGRVGRIPAHYSFDAGIKYGITKIKTVFSVCVKNITDERYMTTRRPQGIRVSLPRMVFAGVKVNF